MAEPGPALEQLVDAVEAPTPTGIAAALSLLVRTGTWPPGTRLPTVRDVAAALGVSPATVSHAWHGLAGAGVLVTRGRAGSYVRAADTAWLTPRYRDLAGYHSGFRLDLSTGTPDPELLPDLTAVLARVAGHDLTGSYVETPVLPRLERHLRDTWPGPVEAVTVVDGAFDAMSRSLEAVVRYGDRVLVEDPCFPPLLDLLDALGAEPVPVPLDDQGPDPAALAAALDTSPVALVLQPRAHNPTGLSLSDTRARELGHLLERAPDLVVVEDDHSGDVATAEDVTLGRHLPGRVLHIRSFSKSHGPDLRIAALGGPARLLDRIVARRMLGPGWTSRMLQRVLLELLIGDTGMTAVAEARRVYHARQQHLARALAERGVDVEPGDGVNLWLPVVDEQSAIVRMAAAGIRVAAGETFRSGGPCPDGLRGPHVRVTAGMVRGDFAQVGAELADGALAR
ncbi:MAG: aminotransferase class I/II-fold pyridoxal phosphate-dependent enzyme [Actinobacteria bacterium]|nr:aminotransferase class I/II-fold pyridoxal phosphate-dependent enzyme [Actinomycetota bacterium]MCG2799794.1 aminotransferase class I/II-fold pyridoxal phosphate-dependent enzyme [Cellulomonas sp.]